MRNAGSIELLRFLTLCFHEMMMLITGVSCSLTSTQIMGAKTPHHGLGAPVGSIIVGNADFIHRSKVLRCRRHRKSLGGGWRQAGILAAAAIYALEHASTTVSNDHHNAQYLCKLHSFLSNVSTIAVLNEVTPREKGDILFAKSATNMVLLTVL
uniref:Aromatic amino acid beta-eliminating lyase/threonine aldolase domain-containing protein n=1 Tax=Parascaris equorum TaxID=6256 RepID=A0A914R5Y6_PAREQ